MLLSELTLERGEFDLALPAIPLPQALALLGLLVVNDFAQALSFFREAVEFRAVDDGAAALAAFDDRREVREVWVRGW